jgi:transcriptional regulator with XRE-family HTH domain
VDIKLPKSQIEDAGQKLKRVRDRLSLTIRDVEDASRKIADHHGNDEYVVGLSRLSEIENRGSVPTLFRLYSLCAIYRLEIAEVLEWYGVTLSELVADALLVDIRRTHLLGLRTSDRGDTQFPLSLDPGVDIRKTTFLSRMIQRWGRLPLSLLNGVDLKNHRYGFIGQDDWFMYPLIQPGALVLIDDTKRKIMTSGWTNEFDRPIYFFEHRQGYICGWCTLRDSQLVLQPHPASPCASQVYLYPDDIEPIGQVTGVAIRLDPGRRRRARS